MTIRGDLAEEANCQRAVDQTVPNWAAWTSWSTTSPPSSRWRTSPSSPPSSGTGRSRSTSTATSGPPRPRSAPARRRRRHQHRVDQRAARQQDADRLRGHQGRRPGPHLLPGPGPAGARHPGQQRRAGPGLDAADPGHLRRGEGRRVRQPGADGPRGAPRRDRPVVRLLRRGRLSSYYSGEVLAPIGGETLPG